MLRRVVREIGRRAVILQEKNIKGNSVLHTVYCIRYRHTANASATAPLVSAAGFNDYVTEVKNFKLDVPEYYNFAVDVIDKWADKEKNGDTREHPAFWWVDEISKQEIKWSFTDLAERSIKTAALLQGLCGVREGDRLLVILPRVPQWWLINLACIRIGAVLIPGTTQLTSKDIQSRINQAKVKCVIGDDSVVPNIEKVEDSCPSLQCKIMVSNSSSEKTGWYNFNNLFDDLSDDVLSGPSDLLKPVRSKSDDLMTIYFTSGTTGLPKMTGHTHASYGLACVITGRYWLDLVPSDVHWNLSDTGWAKSAWSNLFAPWIQGACVFVYNPAGFVPDDILRVLQEYPVTTFCTAPTAYRLLVQSDLSQFHSDTLRHCVSAGEPLNPEVIEEWFTHTKLQIREGYGQTETVLQVGAFRCLENKPGSMGKPAPGMPVKVLDEKGEEVQAWQEGDLAIQVAPHRPLGLFVGYMDDPQQTAAAFRGDYYLTGDRAMYDEDGYLWFVGRADDVILSSGYRIGPFEVESALIEHPAVAESAVVSSPDATRGEVVKAFVVLSQAYKDADLGRLGLELQDHVKQTTAPYKYPRKIEFVESLPKTVSGKIRRVELRNKEWGRTES